MSHVFHFVSLNIECYGFNCVHMKHSSGQEIKWEDYNIFFKEDGPLRNGGQKVK